MQSLSFRALFYLRSCLLLGTVLLFSQVSSAQVETDFSSGGAVRVGDAADPSCTAGAEGAIRYNDAGSDTLDYCNGTTWLTLLTSTVGGALIQNGNSFSAPMVIGTNDAQPLSFETGGTTRMSINTLGQVGIGTSTPRAKLDVENGEIRTYFLNSAADATGFRALNTGAAPGTSSSIRLAPGSLDKAILKGISGSSSTEGIFTIETRQGGTPTEVLRIDEGGNVGIGTTLPAGKLDVAGDIRMLGSTSGYAGFQAPANAGDTLWILPTADGANGEVLSTNGSGVLSWVAAGGGGDFMADGSVAMTGPLEVVAGTALAPGISFDGDEDTGFNNSYSGAISFSSNGSDRFTMDNNYLFGSVTGSPALTSLAGTAASPAFTFLSDQDNGMFRPAADQVAFSTSGTEALRIDASGNVGIGTVTPYAPLSFSNNTATGALDNHSEYKIMLYTNSSNPSHSYGLGIRGNTMVFNSGNDFHFDDKGSTVMAIDNSRVGIGTTVPRGDLDVRNTIYVGTTGGSHGFIRGDDRLIFDTDFDNNGSAGEYYFRTDGGSMLMTLDDTGDLFLHSGNLDVNGAADLHDRLDIFINSGADIDALLLRNNHSSSTARTNISLQTGNTIERGLITGGGQGSATDGYLAFATQQSGTVTEAMRIDGSGNVGIGTTTPDEPLQVYDDIDGTHEIDVVNANAGSSAMSTVRLSGNASSAGLSYRSSTNTATLFNNDSAGAIHFFQNGAGTVLHIENNGHVGILDSSADAHFEISADGTTGGSAFMVSSNDSNDGDLMIVNEDGTVGIGTDNPTHILHITGPGRSTQSTWDTTSDARLKNILGDYEYGLNEIRQLQTRWFRYKSDNPYSLPDDQDFMGVVAQELMQVIPEAVREDQNGYYTVNTDPILWALVNAAGDLDRQCRATEEDQGNLQALVEAHDRALASLQSEQGQQKQKMGQLEDRLRQMEAENSQLRQELKAIKKMLQTRPTN